MIKKIGFPPAAAFLVTILAATGYWMLFSSFAVYDDEGYILLSARDYFVQGHLYETVYSQYGPAFYALWDVLQHLANAPADHNWARLTTLAFWIGTAGAGAVMVWRQTNSRSLSLFTLAATFLFLYFITDEPFHPGSLICFVLGASVCVTARLISSRRLSTAAAVAGSTGAFLLLTKINVGVFYLAAVVGWAGVYSISARIRRLSGPGVVAGFCVLAVALMHTLVKEAWVQIYLVLFACGTLSLAVALKGEALLARKQIGSFLVACVALGLAIPAFIWLRGTSLAGLFEGVVLGPLRHPGNYSYPVDWRPGSLPVAVLSVVLAVSYPWVCRRFSKEAGDRLIVSLRMIAGAALLVGFALLINFRAVGAIFSFVAPLVWIWVVPLSKAPLTPEARAGRGLLALILLLQYLHAYPVGGSQESWGVFLFVPLVALGLGDVRRWLALRSGEARTAAFRSWPVIASLVMIVLIAKVGWTAQAAYRHYAAGSPLKLPGAARLHLPDIQAASYRIFTLNAVVHGDMLFSLPGMFSFNVWTGLPTPTDKNTTLWFSLLNATEQQEIIDALENKPRAVLIVQESLLELMQANNLPMRGPLWDYIHRNFNAAFRSNGFAFWVHNGRSVSPFNLATVSIRRSPDSAGQIHDTLLSFNLVHDGAPIAAIAVRSGDDGRENPLVLDGKNSLVTVTPINTAGQSMGQPAPATWPLTHKGLIRVDVYSDLDSHSFSPSDTLLRLRGPHSENLGEMMIAQ